MKKYFIFDNEPITGNSYWQRMVVGYIFSFVLIGLWLIAATAYKRAGAFGWKKEIKNLTAILIPIFAIANLLSKVKGYNDLPLNLFDIIALIAAIFHIILLWGNGNKDLKNAIINQFEIANSELWDYQNVVLKTRFLRNTLHFQLIGKQLETFDESQDKIIVPIDLIFYQNELEEILRVKLPKNISSQKNNKYLKGGVLKYESSIELNEIVAKQVSSVSISSDLA